MKESYIESYLVRKVKEHGGLCYKFVSPGNPGVPDRLIITPTGKTIFVELKTEVAGWPKSRNGSGVRWRNGGRTAGCCLGWTQ